MKPEDEIMPGEMAAEQTEAVSPETAAEAAETVNTDDVSPEITAEAPGSMEEVAPVTDAATEEAPAQVATLAMRLIEALKDDLAEGATEDEMVQTVTGLLEYRTKNREANARLVKVFEYNPDLLRLIRLIDEGATLAEALPFVIDVENLAPVEGEPEFEKWNQAKTERASKMQAQQAETDEILANLDMSAKQISSFAEKNGLTPEAANDFIETISNFIEEASTGKITEPILTSLYKGMNYDADLANTEEIAEIRGRNQGIEEKIAKEKAPKGDGLPSLTSAASEVEKPEMPDDGWTADLVASQKRRNRF